MTYPKHFARGITRPECVSGDEVKRCTFEFKKNPNGDLWELSVQWLDNEESENILKSMRRKDSDHPQFVIGFAVLPTEKLEEIRKIEEYNVLEYSRVPTETPFFHNKYHGHLSVPKIEPRIRKQLGAELAHRSKKYAFDQKLPVG